MNIVLFEPHELRGSQLILTDRRAEHLRQILKVAKGDQIKVGQLNGLTGLGQVSELQDEHVLLNLQNLDSPPPPPLRVKVILALPRPKVLPRALKSLTEMGVKEIILLNAAKVEKPYWQAQQLTHPKIEHALRLGLEQSGDTLLPQVFLQPRFRPFVEDRLKDFSSGTQGWVAHPYCKQALLTESNTSQALTLAIGPEGGWVDFELSLFEQQGFKLGHIGPRTLSVTTALIALLSRVRP
ncbi:MAG: 16S rRNA (uracil(1498)-N(3))-methyltransferase [Bdellovibrionales bacterium]